MRQQESPLIETRLHRPGSSVASAASLQPGRISRLSSMHPNVAVARPASTMEKTHSTQRRGDDMYSVLCYQGQPTIYFHAVISRSAFVWQGQFIGSTGSSGATPMTE